MKIILLSFLGFLFPFSALSVELSAEKTLSIQCSKGDLSSCESLAIYFLRYEKWENAELLGEAICKKNIPVGCTIKGMALLKNKKISEGTKLLNLACDQFEPYSCRSLGRLIKTSGDSTLSHVYFRKACHFGLRDVCQDLQKNKKVLSKSGHHFFNKMSEDCLDTNSSLCKERLQSLNNCAKILDSKDCMIIPSLLTIFFRAKLIQSEAKGLLTQIFMGQKRLKEDQKVKSYSYDLAQVLKDYRSHKKYQYVFGFKKNCSGRNKATSLDLFPQSYNLNAKSTQSIRKEFKSGKKQECYDPKWGFEAFAISNLDPINPGHLDIWKINQDGNLIHQKDGLPVQR